MDALSQAIKQGDLNAFKQALATISVNRYNEEMGTTPLLEAIHYKRASMARILIERGACVNQENLNTGELPLQMAIERGMTKTALLLIKRDADLNALDERLLSPLQVAVCNKRLIVAKELLKRKVKPNPTNYWAPSPLCAATWNKQKEMVDLLKSYGADINAVDEYGCTELFYVTSGDWAKALIKAGINVDAQDKEGKTALFKFARFMEYFLESAEDDDFEAYKEDCEIFDHILNANANVSIADNHGRTVFDVVSNKTVLNKLEKALKRRNRRISRNEFSVPHTPNRQRMG